MAIYHLNAKIGRRSDGQSARAAACYVLRTGRYENDHDEVLYSQSGNMPVFAAADELAYWDAADLYERANGRLYRSLEYALPIEPDSDVRQELATSFAEELTNEEQLPYTLAIHAGKGHNPHCHLLISERRNDGVNRPAELWFRRHNSTAPQQGGAKKTASMVTKGWLYNARERWSALANRVLQAAGVDARIDHRTLAEQGIDRIPGIHLGPNVAEMTRKRIPTDRADQARAIRQANLIIQQRPRDGTVAQESTTALVLEQQGQWIPPSPRLKRAGALKEEENAPARGTAPDRTTQEVQRQGAAMGCAYFEVCIEHPLTADRELYRWNLQTILDSLQYIKQKNTQGHIILIRPATHPLTGLVFVDGLSSTAVEQMRSDGYEPVVALEIAPDKYQVWIRAGEHVLTTRRAEMARYLAETYLGNVEAAGGSSYGRLAGFTNHDQGLSDWPLVQVRHSDTSGGAATRAKDLLKIAQERLEQRQQSKEAPKPSL